LAQLESYIKGLLTSHGTMSLDRLYTMLKLISTTAGRNAAAGTAGSNSSSSDGAFDMNAQQLRAYLQSLVDRRTIECTGGLFSMVKETTPASPATASGDANNTNAS